MLKQKDLQNNDSKKKYIKPECVIYEIEFEASILINSGEDVTNINNTTVNSFLPGETYDLSVF